MSSKAVKEKLVWEGDDNSVGGERSRPGRGEVCVCWGWGREVVRVGAMETRPGVL